MDDIDFNTDHFNLIEIFNQKCSPFDQSLEKSNYK